MDVSLIMRHPRPDSIRLKRSQIYFLYAVLALLSWAEWRGRIGITFDRLGIFRQARNPGQ